MPTVTEGWGRRTWGRANWIESTLYTEGWGALGWGDNEWGELKDATVTPTGISFTASIGSVTCV